jgi:hypothetical protein
MEAALWEFTYQARGFELYEEYCVSSEEQEFNRGVRNPAGGDLEHSRPLH